MLCLPSQSSFHRPAPWLTAEDQYVNCYRAIPSDSILRDCGFMEDSPEWPESNDFDEYEIKLTKFWFANRKAYRTGSAILRVFRAQDSVNVQEWPEGLHIGQIGRGKRLTIVG